MADYDNPRPSSQPEGSTDLAVAKDNLITLDKVLVSSENEVTNRKNEPRKTLAGMESEVDERIAAAIRAAGYQIVGDFADATKVAITSDNQVYTSKSVVGFEGALWRTNQVLPYAPTGSDPTQPPEKSKWLAVTTGETVRAASTIIAIVQESLAVGALIETKGYYEVGDGGGAKYLNRGQGWPETADGYVNLSTDVGDFLELQKDSVVSAAQVGMTEAHPDVTGLNTIIDMWHPARVDKGEYNITETIHYPRSSLKGSGMEDCFIKPVVTDDGFGNLTSFAAFAFSEDGYPNGGLLRGFHVKYTDTIGETRPVGSVGVYMFRDNPSGNPAHSYYPGQTQIEQVYVQGAVRGFYDFGGNFMQGMRNCTARFCDQAFSKSGGTTMTYTNCYSYDCIKGFDVNVCLNVVMLNCAADGLNPTTLTNGLALNIRNSNTVIINGWDCEGTNIKDNGVLYNFTQNTYIEFSGGIFFSVSAGGGTGSCEVLRVDNCLYARVSLDVSGIYIQDAPANTQTVTAINSINSTIDIPFGLLTFARTPTGTVKSINNTSNTSEIVFNSGRIGHGADLVRALGTYRFPYTHTAPFLVGSVTKRLVDTITLDSAVKIGADLVVSPHSYNEFITYEAKCFTDGTISLYAMNSDDTASHQVSGTVSIQRTKTINDYIV